jgi:flagellar basal-body rod protein FlgG
VALPPTAPQTSRGPRPSLSEAWRALLLISGNVTEDGKQVARLKIVAFDDERSLHRLGDGLMSGGSTTVPISDGQTSVRQGYLENSNVSTLTEMTQLIQTARHFETMQRIAQGFDEMTGTAIRRLGEA